MRLLFLIILVSNLIQGQELTNFQNAKLVNNNDIFYEYPFIDGFNLPIFNELNLNDNETTDLIISDSGSHISVIDFEIGKLLEIDNNFLPIGLPDSFSWIKIIDINCDGIEDVCYANNEDYKFYVKNGFINTSNKLEFTSTISEFEFEHLDRFNEPAFFDFNGDSFIDILHFDLFSNRFLVYYNLASTANCTPFFAEPVCFGNVYLNPFIDSIAYNNPCGGKNKVDSKIHLTTSSSTIYDYNKDGIYDIMFGYSDSLFSVLLGNFVDNEYFIEEKIQIFESETIVKNNVLNSVFITEDENCTHLILSPSDPEFISGTDNISLFECFENENSISAFYISNEVLDIGTHSFPVFYDFDKDGLVDLFISNKTTFGNFFTPDSLDSKFIHSSIYHYKNIGTVDTAIFKLVDNDFGNIYDYQSNTIYHSFADLNKDSFVDLILTSSSLTNKLLYFENSTTTNNEGQTLFLDPDTIELSPLSTGSIKPFFFDIDNDNEADLFTADKIGTIAYYKNTGNENISFELVDTLWGNIQLLSEGNSNFPSQSISIWKDINNEINAVCGTIDGKILLFEKYDAVLNEFENEQQIFNKRKAPYTNICSSDLNNDGYAEFGIGSYLGGLKILTTKVSDDETTINQLTKEVLTVFPNPAKSYLNIESRFSGILNIYDLSAKLIFETNLKIGLNSINIDLKSGIYLLQAIDKNNVNILSDKLIINNQ